MQSIITLECITLAFEFDFNQCMEIIRRSKRERKNTTKLKESFSIACEWENWNEATRKNKTDKSRSKSKERNNATPRTKNAHEKIWNFFTDNENDLEVDDESRIGITKYMILKEPMNYDENTKDEDK